MTEIDDLLDRHGHFHDWYLETIIIRGEVRPKVPDTLILGLFDEDRRAILTFRGVSRIGIENAGVLNIVYAIDLIKPNSEAFDQARKLLAVSSREPHEGKSVVYLYSTIGAEIAVEFDSMSVEAMSEDEAPE